MKKFSYLLPLFYFSIIAQAQIVWEPTELNVGASSIKVSENGTIFAGGLDGKLYKSTDNGDNWSTIIVGTSYQIQDIAFASNGYMFLTTGGNETGDGVFRSSDGGAIWQQCTMTAGLETRDVKIKANTIYVSTYDQGLGKSTDNGDTWSGASSSVPEDNCGAFNITNNGTLLLAVKGSGGIYRSTDDGASWNITNMNQSPEVYSLTVAVNNYIFAATADENHDGIYRSTNDGATWTKIKSDNNEYYMEGVATSDGKIYLGAMGIGIFSTSDYGATWDLHAQGFQNLIGFALAIGIDGTIYSTTVEDVYKSTGTTGVGYNELSINDFQLAQNYPNPFNPSTTISYSLPVQHQVSLKVYDVLGNEVASLVNEEQNAGSHSINFSAAQLSSGIYFYRLNIGNFSETKSMILIK
jgi:photosystem II stability/assembly factor-like uncharacterized protein